MCIIQVYFNLVTVICVYSSCDI